jgi:antitoxin component YwqK of YwqJK toxin-antitoxin module
MACGNFLYAQRVTVHTYYDETETRLKETFMVLEGQGNILDGKYMSFYQNGNTKSEGFYKNNDPIGYWNYYYESGKLKMRGQLRGNSNYGMWKYYYENGQVSMEGNIYNGKREGEWRFYFESSAKKSIGNFKNGEKLGIWNHYYEDGTLKAQAYYEEDLGFYKEFYNNGNVKVQGYKINGKSDSTWIYFYENGIKQADGRYKEGLRSGLWSYFYENGNISASGYYENGDKDGQWTYYHENGKKSSEGLERKGRKEGNWRIYDNEGYMKGEGYFESGTGEYKEYYDNGNLKITGEMKDGIHVGKWMYYYEDGILEGTASFINGEGDYTGYYHNGKMKMKGKIKNGKNVGNWELYKEDGSVAGYYKPIYEEDKPVFIVGENTSNGEVQGDYMKPDYKYKKRQNRYFTPVINEYHGLIIATNPLAMIVDNLPVSLEYYFQERMGYEALFNIIRDPFFKNGDSVQPYELYKRGFSMAVRQKFYHQEMGIGMLYFSNELRYSYIKHQFNTLDSANLASDITYKVSATEHLYEYSFILGNRWMKLFGETWNVKSRQSGITVDFFIGVGIGYRDFKKNYSDNLFNDKIFEDLRQSKFVISPRFGVNIGYVF